MIHAPVLPTGIENYKFKVLLDIGTQDTNRVALFQNWLSIWCRMHCDSDWAVCRSQEPSNDYQLIIAFSDPKEAVHFKLTSGNLHVKEMKNISFFLN